VIGDPIVVLIAAAPRDDFRAPHSVTSSAVASRDDRDAL